VAVGTGIQAALAILNGISAAAARGGCRFLVLQYEAPAPSGCCAGHNAEKTANPMASRHYKTNSYQRNKNKG